MTTRKSEPTVAWGCDDTTEGTLHNGVGDARVNGLPSQMQTDEQTANCIVSLQASQHAARERSRATAEAAVPGHHPASPEDAALSELMAPLRHFTLASASSEAPELRLYDAMLSPDRQLLKAKYFVAEGSLIIQQLLKMGTTYRLASILSTEAQLRKLMPDLAEADASYELTAASTHMTPSAGAEGGESAAAHSSPSASHATAPCLVFAGGRADVSRATGFKHSALSVLAIVHRPESEVHMALERWLPSLRAAVGPPLADPDVSRKARN